MKLRLAWCRVSHEQAQRRDALERIAMVGLRDLDERIARLDDQLSPTGLAGYAATRFRALSVGGRLSAHAAGIITAEVCHYAIGLHVLRADLVLRRERHRDNCDELGLQLPATMVESGAS